MSTHTRILYQVVFASKNRHAFLTPENQNRLFSYIVGMIKKRNCYCYIVGGHQDHIHLIFELNPDYKLSDLVKEIKNASNTFMKQQIDLFPNFIAWQIGYGAFSYHRDSLPFLTKYVTNQESNHKNMDYRDELIKLYIEHGIEYDDRYL